MDIKSLIYGQAYYFYSMYDCALECFKNTDTLPIELFRGTNPPPYFDSIVRFLESEGMIICNSHYVIRTEKGRILTMEGGYLRTALRHRLNRLAIILSIIGSGVSILIVLCRS